MSIQLDIGFRDQNRKTDEKKTTPSNLEIARIWPFSEIRPFSV
jgi:hypothetical protein